MTVHHRARAVLDLARGPAAGRRRAAPDPAPVAGGSGTTPGPRTAPPRAFRLGLVATLGAGLGVGIIAAVVTLSQVLVYVGLAFFLALAFEPVVRRIARLGAPRWVGVLVTVVLTVVAVAALLWAVVPRLAEQIGYLVQEAPAFLTDLSRQDWVRDTVRALGFDLDLDALVGTVSGYLLDPDRLLTLGGGILAVGQGLVSAVTAVIVVAILTLYFAVTLPQMIRSLSRAVPRSHRDGVVAVADEIFLSVGRYVAGQIALAALNGVFVFVVLTIAGGPLPVLFATLAFLGALIPVVGTVVAYAIIVVGTLTVGPVTALVVGIVLLVYAQVEAYVLTPRVMSKAVAVPGALVIVAAFGGAALGGVLGALVAIPVATAGVIIFDEVVVPRMQRR
ncbi:AI-2E family transporter [Frigoribacterium salinisoli]